ncbi:uncharacterized protein [Littorina saxatilis]|uniref:uncharacterized protein n=1 Tax=Littorina saxatilis TaxID=31220 RepID=UPI0038B5F040
MMVSGGVVGCLQFLLFIWSEHSNDSIMHVNVFLLCTSAVTFLHPLHLLWKCWRSHPPPSSSDFSSVAYSPADSASRQNPSEKAKGNSSCDTPNAEVSISLLNR